VLSVDDRPLGGKRIPTGNPDFLEIILAREKDDENRRRNVKIGRIKSWGDREALIMEIV